MGGFASTVFMPLTQLLIGALGWRNALVILGGLNLTMCLPLHALFVPTKTASHPPEVTQDDAPPAHELRAMLRGRVFVGLAIWFTAYGAAQSVFIFQFVPLLTT